MIKLQMAECCGPRTHIPQKVVGSNQASCSFPLKKDFCKYSPKYSAANITGFVDIPRDESSLREAVATVGPVSVGIDTLPETFLFYERGKH